MIAVFDCFSGISGDMTIGAFIDAGMPLDHLQTELAKIEIGGYELSTEKVMRRGLCGVKFNVSEHEHSHVQEKKHTHEHDHHSHEHKQHDHHHKHHNDSDDTSHKHDHSHNHGVTFKVIRERIEKSSLSERVKQDSLRIFSVLAKAEAAVHGKSIDAVHFHEVGAVDSIVDIIGIAVCLEYFNITKIYVRTLHTGCGVLHGSSHGSFPLPAPATSKLLEGFKVVSSGIEKELVTPTGAAFLAAFAEKDSCIPDMIVHSNSFGAGTRDNPQRANLLRLVLMQDVNDTSFGKCRIVEACIDDMHAEFFSPLFERLFEAGAMDVYTENIMMKKNRPAQKISALCEIEKEGCVRACLFKHTTTAGIRVLDADRYVLERQEQSFDFGRHLFRVKFLRLEDGSVRFKPEYEDCCEIARLENKSISQVRDELTCFVRDNIDIESMFGEGK